MKLASFLDSIFTHNYWENEELDLFKIVDLTQPLSNNAPTWDGSCGYSLKIKHDYNPLFRVQNIEVHAGIGTHMDAPSHRIPGGKSIADIPVEQFIAPACVIDVSDKAGEDYLIAAQDVLSYESSHGMIPDGSLVIGFTGWSRFWTNPTKYRNIDVNGRMHFPAFSAQAAEVLLQRNIKGIAIDTLSPDCLDDSFPVHKLILGAGKYIIENIRECSQMPPCGAFVIALPLYAEGATESPMRIIALIPY